MTNATTAEILDGVVSVLLANTTGLGCYAYRPDNFKAPIAVVWPQEVRYHGAMGQGDVEHDLVVTVVVSRVAEPSAAAAIKQFLSYAGTNSIRAAIETDVTLGGVVDTCVVNRGRQVGTVSQNEAVYAVLDFDMTVYP